MKRVIEVTLRVSFDDERLPTHPYYWDWTLLINQQGASADVVKTQDKANPEQQPLTLETLEVKHLHALLFVAPECEQARPQSIHRNDSPIERVKVVPHDLGKFIAELDPNEQYFHVEFWAPHAEIWSARAWRDSLTRLLRHKSTAAENDDQVSLKQTVLNELIQLIARVTRVSYDRAEKSAQAIIHFGEQYDVMLDLLQVSPDLKVRLLRLRKLIAEQSSQQDETENSSGLQNE